VLGFSIEILTTHVWTVAQKLNIQGYCWLQLQPRLWSLVCSHTFITLGTVQALDKLVLACVYSIWPHKKCF
jgi:hypothetical protein